MPKNNTVSDWHRQQHKKKVQKNKVARIAARDERIKTEKTEGSILEEIRKLERQFVINKKTNSESTPSRPPHHIQSKLDRLNKELKLIRQETEKNQNQQGSTSTTKSHQLQQPAAAASSYVPLANPAISVYYDATLNPYGAPPPGQPMLYHRRGGGTTMNLYEAGLLGEPQLPPPPPPPIMMNMPSAQTAWPLQNAQQQPIFDASSRSRIIGSTGTVKSNRFLPNQSASYQSTLSRHLPPPPPPPNQSASNRSPPPPPPPPPPPAPIKTLANTKDKPISANQQSKDNVKITSMQLPALPLPSAAVGRMRRRVDVDIWASVEEIEYEEKAGIGSLEGTAKVVTEWWYRDMSGIIQGPFPTNEMKGWVQAGFFPPSTFVRSSPEDDWTPLAKVSTFQWILDMSMGLDPDLEQNTNNSQETPLLLSSSSSVQDRIAALRRQRIQDEEEVDESDVSTSSVAERIAALRADSLDQNGIKRSSNEVELREAIPENDNNEMPNREPAGPLTNNDKLKVNNVQEQPPPPPARLSAAVGSVENVPLYPISDFASLPAYPISDEIPPSYPIESIDLDEVPYPIDDEYPASSGEYPVIDPYPVDEGNYNSDRIHMEKNNPLTYAEPPPPPKKKLKIDKNLVAFLPSHIQKKRAMGNRSDA